MQRECAPISGISIGPPTLSNDSSPDWTFKATSNRRSLTRPSSESSKSSASSLNRLAASTCEFVQQRLRFPQVQAGLPVELSPIVCNVRALARESRPNEETIPMPLSVHQSSVAVFEVMLKAFSAILDKALAHAEAHKFDPTVYMTMRLRPDMLPFGRQVMIVCDNAKNVPSRLAGVQAPVFEDNEATLDQLKARIQRTLDYLQTLDAKAIEVGRGSRDRDPARAEQDEDAGGQLSPAFRAAEFLFPSDDRLRHPALCRRRCRQARLPRRRSRHRAGVRKL